MGLFLLGTDRLLRPKGGGMVLQGGGYNFKTSPLFGGKFFTYEKCEGGPIL